jgi:methyl-accepting chemotaxis protein
MTPEERLTRIENAIQALVETQARHDAQLEKHSAILEQHTAMLEKQSDGIRDLIVVSRTLVDAQQAADTTIRQLIGTVDRLVQTVDQLSGSVDTLVKSFQKPNGNLM